MKKYTQPLISIIVPVFNTEDYLSECIDSILQQTYANLEIIIINDGSTDSSSKLIKAYKRKDKRVTLIDKKNGGVSSARNDGLTKANGEYIVFIDSDDYLKDVKALEKLENVMQRNIDVAICGVFCEDGRSSFSYNEKEYKNKNEFDELLYQLIKSERLNPPFGRIYRKKIIDKYNIRFDSNIKIGEDLLFNIQYFKHCHSAYYINDLLYFYRTSNAGSATKKYMKNKYKELMHVNDQLTKWVSSVNNPRLSDISKYIRMKNILSCLRDINHPSSELSEAEKCKEMQRYKLENPRIVIKHCGAKIYVISLVFNLLSFQALSKLMNAIQGVR